MAASPGTWLKVSEWTLLASGVVLVIGLVGEVIGERRASRYSDLSSGWLIWPPAAKRTSRFWKKVVRFGAILVIGGVVGELFGDGGAFVFSARLQTQTESLLSRQGSLIEELTTQLNTTQTALSTAIDNNKVLLAVQGAQSEQIRQLQKKEGAPSVWSMTLYFPTNGTFNGPAGAYNFASFTPEKDITITRIMSPFLGTSGVLTGQSPKAQPCSRPPYFYLSAGYNGGVCGKNVLFVLPLETGDYAGTMESVAADSGPISVDVAAGQLITASYQVGFDPRGCWNLTHMNQANVLVPDNITVEYVAKPKAKH